MIVIVTYLVTYRSVGAKPTDRMGTGDWKFTESWASTLTALGGILGIILAADLLPSKTSAEKLVAGTFTTYNLMFAIVIVIGTALYNTFRAQNDVLKPTTGTPKAGETPRIDPPQPTAPATIQ